MMALRTSRKEKTAMGEAVGRSRMRRLEVMLDVRNEKYQIKYLE